MCMPPVTKYHLWGQFSLANDTMQKQHTVITATVLLTFTVLTVSSKDRFTGISDEKTGTITLIHDDDKIVFRRHEHEEPEAVEKDEDNEVISVRLLNSYHSKPFSVKAEDAQNVSYENVQESQDNVLVDRASVPEFNASTVREDPVDSSTVTPTTSSSTPATATLENSHEHDWVRTRIEIPEPSEASIEKVVSTTQPHFLAQSATKTSTAKPQILTTSTLLTTPVTAENSTKSTSRSTTSLTTVNVPTTSTQPPVTHQDNRFGIRKRTVRDHNIQHQPPRIDLNGIDLANLDYSEVDGMRLKDILSTRFVPESVEQPRRSVSHRPQKQSRANDDCPCANQPPQTTHDVDYDVPEDYADYEQPAGRRQFPRLKRLLSDPNESAGDYSGTDLSVERAERMHGALERIMGIVTIMSHVDNFIQQKTKQTIRRLARLYESSEK